MNSRVLLSIALISAVSSTSVSANTAQSTTQEPQKVVKKEETHGGKCASGKCGTEKIYGKANVNHNPQGKLVRARDGKCGTDGNGINETAKATDNSKCVGGVCGQ